MTYFKTLILLSLSGSLLYLVFHKVNFDSVVTSIASIPIFYLVISLCLVSGSVYVKLRRWKSLLIALKSDVTNSNILSANSIGFLSDQVLPAKAGELIRSYLVGKNESIGTATVFGTVILERILDIFSMIVVTSPVIFLLSTSHKQILIAQAGGVGLLAFALVGIVLLVRFSSSSIHFAKKLAPVKFQTEIENGILSLTQGLTIIKHWRQLLMPTFWSILMWILIAGSIGPILLAFDISTQIPLSAICTILLFVTLGLSLPAAPAGIGIFEYACYLALVMYLPDSQLDSPAIITQIGLFAGLLHLTFALPELLLGGYFLSREQLTIRALSLLSRKIRIG